jgi:hypothetical protein
MFGNQIITKNTDMRKIILTLAACAIGLTGAIAQSIELTPSGYAGEHQSGDNIDLKTSSVPVLNMYRFGGTLTSPTALPGGFTIMRLGGGGYDGTDYRSLSARLDFRTTSTWSASNRGTFMRFITTPDGSTGSIESMRITSDGLVGIGTSDPQQKLHVSGGDMIIEDTTPFLSFRNTGDAGATGVNFGTSTGSVRAQIKYTPLTSSDGVVQILEGTGSNNGLFLIDGPGTSNSGNNIGINEDEPRGRLHIRSNSQPTNPSILIEENNNGTVDAMTFENSSATEKWHIKYQANDTDANANFKINASNTGDVVTFTGDGNTEHHGFTHLGDESTDDAPAIKMKKITGTTDSDATTTVSHGLTRDKILAVDIHISNGGGVNYPPNALSAVADQYRYFINSAVITMSNVGADLQGQSYWILITYEE